MMIYLLADLSEMKVQIETRSLSLLFETYCFHFVIYLTNKNNFYSYNQFKTSFLN